MYFGRKPKLAFLTYLYSGSVISCHAFNVDSSLGLKLKLGFCWDNWSCSFCFLIDLLFSSALIDHLQQIWLIIDVWLVFSLENNLCVPHVFFWSFTMSDWQHIASDLINDGTFLCPVVCVCGVTVWYLASVLNWPGQQRQCVRHGVLAHAVGQYGRVPKIFKISGIKRCLNVLMANDVKVFTVIPGHRW